MLLRSPSEPQAPTPVPFDALARTGAGIDTSRDLHDTAVLRDDLQPAAARAQVRGLGNSS